MAQSDSGLPFLRGRPNTVPGPRRHVLHALARSLEVASRNNADATSGTEPGSLAISLNTDPEVAPACPGIPPEPTPSPPEFVSAHAKPASGTATAAALKKRLFIAVANVDWSEVDYLPSVGALWRGSKVASSSRLVVPVFNMAR